MPDLRTMTPEQLEQEANMLLYGHKRGSTEGGRSQLFSLRRLYRPRNLHADPVYSKPRVCEGECAECRKPKSYGAAALCRPCFLAASKTRFHSSVDAAEYWEGMCRATMPDTEWWDDAIIGTQPNSYENWSRGDPR
jgi:hypothetical protein